MASKARHVPETPPARVQRCGRKRANAGPSWCAHHGTTAARVGASRPWRSHQSPLMRPASVTKGVIEKPGAGRVPSPRVLRKPARPLRLEGRRDRVAVVEQRVRKVPNEPKEAGSVEEILGLDNAQEGDRHTILLSIGGDRKSVV